MFISQELERVASASSHLHLVETEIRGFYADFGKRVLDLIIVVLAAPAWLLVYAVFAAIILIAEGRPIHHRSSRVGAGGRDMTVLKLRTMRPDADSSLASILAADPTLDREFRETFKLQRDPRVTSVGQVLRRLSLDEVPQLLNILRGDMSLVGPRPVLRSELEEYYADAGGTVLQVRPGLTGLWQVSGRSLLSYETRVRLDLEYLSRCSLVTDAVILLKTIPCVLRRQGAY
ncbi:MAG: sugar transferase [Actinomycetota bacterium]